MYWCYLGFLLPTPLLTCLRYSSWHPRLLTKSSPSQSPIGVSTSCHKPAHKQAGVFNSINVSVYLKTIKQAYTVAPILKLLFIQTVYYSLSVIYQTFIGVSLTFHSCSDRRPQQSPRHLYTTRVKQYEYCCNLVQVAYSFHDGIYSSVSLGGKAFYVRTYNLHTALEGQVLGLPGDSLIGYGGGGGQ